MNFQWPFLPHEEVSLVHPIFCFMIKGDIEFEDYQREDQTHFAVCKARNKLIPTFSHCTSLYLLSTKAVSRPNVEWL